jgi:NAD(P)-dependent dehydrogenase (short-subunit alcohol dehydrogenase family)
MSKDLEGKTIVITGASAGIGAAVARDLGKRGARMILATRSEEKTRPLLAEIEKSEWVRLDLASLASVKQAADEIARRTSDIHVLIANAGVAGSTGATKDGFEIAFGTNHLGHFVFVRRLLPLLEKSAPSRVVIVASAAHFRAPGLDWDALRSPTRSLTGWREYQTSKLCNVLFARELARREKEKNVHVYAVHPGVVASELWRRVPWPLRSVMKLGMRTNEEGAFSTIHTATSPDVAEETGLYYSERGTPREPSALARDDQLAAELWQRSEAWTKDYLS